MIEDNISINIYGAPSKLAIVNKNRLLTIQIKDLVEGAENP